MNRYVMTAKRKASLRKAQLASARKRKGKGRGTSRPVSRRGIYTAVGALALAGAGLSLSSRKGARRHPPTAVPVFKPMQTALPGGNSMGQRAVTGVTRRALTASARRSRPSRVNNGRVKDSSSPYYRTRWQRGAAIRKRNRTNGPDILSGGLTVNQRRGRGTNVLVTNSRGTTVVRSRVQVATMVYGDKVKRRGNG